MPTQQEKIKKTRKVIWKNSYCARLCGTSLQSSATNSKKIAHNKANGMYCYKRTTPGGLTYYEVFRAPKAKDEDGNIYHHYPSSAQFGFGTALCIRGGEKRTADKIAFYMANGFIAGRCQASP